MVVHCVVEGKAVCTAGAPENWPEGDTGITDAARLKGHPELVTCPHCVNVLGTVLTAPRTLDSQVIADDANELEREGLFDDPTRPPET